MHQPVSVLIEIGEAHGKSSVQVTLRWALQHEPVAVIPKASSDAHRISNLDVFDFELTGEQMAAISGLGHPRSSSRLRDLWMMGRTHRRMKILQPFRSK